MNIEEISEILDDLPLGNTEYEFENFCLETIPTTSRQLVSVMMEIEDLYAEKQRLEGEISAKTPKQSIKEWDRIKINRQLKIVEQKLDQRYSWYQKMEPVVRKATLADYERQEHDYWANYLGRQAALEILTTGRTSKPTMEKMASLPIESFEDAVSICVRFANLVKDTTAVVESSTGVSTAGTQES